MQSVIFTTTNGTEIEIRNVQSAFAVDLGQAFAQTLEHAEKLAAAGQLDPVATLIESPLLQSGVMSVMIPGEEFDEIDEDEDEDLVIQEAAPVLQEVPQAPPAQVANDTESQIEGYDEETVARALQVLRDNGYGVAEDQTGAEKGHFFCGGCGKQHEIPEIVMLIAAMALASEKAAA